MMSSLPNRRATLQRLLDAYTPRTPLEREHEASLRALLGTAGDPFDRAHYDPGHFTASAFILAPQRDALLLIHHRKLKRWLQPGGHIEPADADVLAASLREATEETGVRDLAPAHDGIFDVDVHEIPGRPDAPPHRHFDVRFLFIAPTRELNASDEVAGAAWVALGNVNAYESDESVLRAVSKLQAGG